MKYQLNGEPQQQSVTHRRSNYADELNAQQYAAVSSIAKHALVIAGAGSGKTRTLTYRVSWLIDQGVPAWRILLLTFTNKASREMLGRVKELAGDEATQVWGGTFHSVANRMLRRHAELLGYQSGFTILDSDDQSAMMRSLVKQFGPPASLQKDKKKLFPKASIISSLLSYANNAGLVWQDVLYERYPQLDIFIDEIAAIIDNYAKRKMSSNAMDFDDLLLNALRLLEEHPSVREDYQRRFAHVLVDEYQDSNKPQEQLITLLAGGPNCSLMAVGDDAQSIYSWRGASVEHIFRFEENYPGAQIYKIETNYRSVPAILQVSNAAIALNSRQYAKELHSVREEGSLLPAVVPLPDKRTEALFVAQRIDELVDGVQFRGKDIAILYRAHFHSMDIQMALTRAHIPFRITSGLRFFEQAHVKDVVALLRLLVNPRDQVALRRIIVMYPRVGALTAQKLADNWLTQLDEQNLNSSSLRGHFVEQMGALKGQNSALKPHWQEFLALMDSLDSPDLEESERNNPSELVAKITEYLMPYLRSNYEDLAERVEDLKHLHEASPSGAVLDDFLADMALLSEMDKQNVQDDDELVTLSSIHQAKGLEWKVVFVLSLSDGLFPHRRVLEQGDIVGLEEETRLFYVAVTRAQDQLYLLYPRYSGGYDGQYCPPSRFLTGLPKELVEVWEC